MVKYGPLGALRRPACDEARDHDIVSPLHFLVQPKGTVSSKVGTAATGLSVAGPAAAAPPTEAAAADPESVAMLTSMGFTAEQAEGALKATQGALDRAADWCAPPLQPGRCPLDCSPCD